MTEAARGICYENAVMADLAHTSGDAAAQAKYDLLTPISKPSVPTLPMKLPPSAFKCMAEWALLRKPGPRNMLGMRAF